MKTSGHLKIAGALQVAQSLSSLPFGIMYIILYIRDLQQASQDFELSMFLILALILSVGACQLWFGISLITQKQWTTRIWGFICCIPSLLIFPPVILGAYTIWVLLKVKKEGGTQ